MQSLPTERATLRVPWREGGEALLQRLLAFAKECKAGPVLILSSNRYFASGSHVGRPTYERFELLAGIGARRVLSQNAGQAFHALQDFYRKSQDYLFGYLAYDLKNEVEKLQSGHLDGVGLPDMFFFQPETVIALHGDELEISVLPPGDPKAVWQQIQNASTFAVSPTKPLRFQARFEKDEYIDRVDRLREHIRQGDVYEVNFCQEFFAEDAVIDPYPLFERLMETAPNPFSAFFRMEGKYLLSASMERFLKKSGSKLISQPIKGTIRRGRSPEEDALLADQLQNDPKERAENIMIVDLVRNDLAHGCLPGTVQVEELCGIYPFATVHQMISTVTGELRSQVTWTDAIRNAFPMGSMTGAPKVKAMELIEKYERTKRGVYSGAVGYITPEGNFDFNVVIRSLLYNADNRYLSLQVGSAITYDSVASKEWEECEVKVGGIKKLFV